MRRPEVIQIGAHKLRIEYAEAATADDDNNVGFFNYEKGLIRISLLTCDGFRRPIVVINNCLWHETIHAITRIYGLQLDEHGIEALAQGITQILEQFGIRFIDAAPD